MGKFRGVDITVANLIAIIICVLFAGVGSAQSAPPAAPLGFVATAESSSRIRLQWETVEVAVIHNLYRCKGLACALPTDCSDYALIEQTANITFTDAGLEPDTTYFYHVLTKNSAGELSINCAVRVTATTLLIGDSPVIFPSDTPSTLSEVREFIQLYIDELR